MRGSKNLNLPKKGSFVGNASLLKRALAFLIDLIVLNIVIVGPFKKVFLSIIPESGNFSELYNHFVNHPEITGKLTTLMIFITILIMLYFIILEWKLGQTLGKALLGIYVVRVGDDKKEKIKKPSFFNAILRNLFLIPFMPFALLWIIEPISILLTKTNQRLLELLSKTQVIERYSF